MINFFNFMKGAFMKLYLYLSGLKFSDLNSWFPLSREFCLLGEDRTSKRKFSNPIGIILLLFLPVAVADIGGEWEFIGYFCRSATGQFQEVSSGEMNLDLTLGFSTEDNSYYLEALWTYDKPWSLNNDYTCEVSAMGAYTVDNSKLNLQASMVDLKVSGPLSCPPSNSGIGGVELQFDFLEIGHLIYFSTGLKCKFKKESSGEENFEGNLYQAIKKSSS